MLKRRSWLGLALAVPFLPGVAQAQGSGMVIFAAASLKNALDEIAATWAKDTGKPAPKISYAASSALAQADGTGRAGRPVHLGRPRLDGLCGGQEPDQARQPLQSFGQQDRADRAQGLQDHDARPQGRRPRQGAGRRQAVDGQCRCRAGRQVRQGGAGEARRLDQRQGQHRPGRECARRARCWWRAARRRSASSTAPTPRPSPASRSWRPSRRIPIRRSSTPPRSTTNSKNADAKAFLDFLRSAKARAVFEKQGFTVLVKSASST